MDKYYFYNLHKIIIDKNKNNHLIISYIELVIRLLLLRLIIADYILFCSLFLYPNNNFFPSKGLSLD